MRNTGESHKKTKLTMSDQLSSPTWQELWDLAERYRQEAEALSKYITEKKGTIAFPQPDIKSKHPTWQELWDLAEYYDQKVEALLKYIEKKDEEVERSKQQVSNAKSISNYYQGLYYKEVEKSFALEQKLGNAGLTDSDTEYESDDDQSCVVCMESESTYICTPCGHMCVCKACAMQVKNKHCPLCRAHVESSLRVYKI
ncbi:hypothetical protein AKO1_005282 [Acrasis kona]|uniref:RING-type domain-containing protein n=1 Tax=Acrasis kona TaxID=1008807 RepID=A0AAW2YKS3_9EUKA